MCPAGPSFQLVLETLFDMRVVLYEIHDALIDPEDGGGRDGRRRLRSGQPRRLGARNIDPRLLQMIERYRELNARRRAAGA